MDEVISNYYSEEDGPSEELLPMLIKVLSDATYEWSPEIETTKSHDEYANLQMKYNRIMDFLRIEDPDLNSKIRDIVRRYASSGSWI